MYGSLGEVLTAVEVGEIDAQGLEVYVSAEEVTATLEEEVSPGESVTRVILRGGDPLAQLVDALAAVGIFGCKGIFKEDL